MQLQTLTRLPSPPPESMDQHQPSACSASRTWPPKSALCLCPSFLALRLGRRPSPSLDRCPLAGFPP
ncbi:hypothetical protein BGZ63DRAFT_393024 [Mariannaea sp. PMI_226]|nr:hypothetical protein BGZ63DRAFT_393024 [Mariannaea sp. PMI_226]